MIYIFAPSLATWGYAALGAAESAIHAGIFGCYSALTAIALRTKPSARQPADIVYGMLASIMAAIGYAAFSAALQPLGMPALTLPFVVVVWAFCLARPSFSRLSPPVG